MMRFIEEDIDMESSTIESHRRLRCRAEAELEVSRKLNPRMDRESLRLAAVDEYACLAERYMNEGSVNMSRAMAVAAAHLGMTFGDREPVSVLTPAGSGSSNARQRLA
jgi:hypothetical protein